MREVDLVPMLEGQFAIFQEDSVVRYAHENIKAGYRTEEDALQWSRNEFQRLLPSGLSTPDNHFFIIRDRASGQEIGAIWLKVETKGSPSAFIYEIFLQEELRGKGFGKATMKALEDLAREKGLKALYLHVFAHNSVAIHLYEVSGFKVRSMNMEKLLE